MTQHSIAEVARIFDLSPSRLRYWQRTALVESSTGLDDQPTFGFRDLVCIRTVLALLEQGVPLRRIRRSVERVRERIPDLDLPLGSLRIWIEGSDRVVVRHQGALVEPEGQLVLDLQLAPRSSEDDTPLPLRPVQEGPDPQRALEAFERGCHLDTDAESYDEAMDAYRTAIEADPDFADAHCNLGTVHYKRGERELARACYERALEHEAEHLEASFNLANILEEAGEDEGALHYYKRAMGADPLYPDVQLNLALLYEKLGLPRTAMGHWRRYLHLVPNGNWAEVARQRLER